MEKFDTIVLVKTSTYAECTISIEIPDNYFSGQKIHIRVIDNTEKIVNVYSKCKILDIYNNLVNIMHDVRNLELIFVDCEQMEKTWVVLNC